MTAITAAASLLAATEAGVQLADGTSLLEPVTLRVLAGEVVAIVGPSGSGKTTLLQMLAGIRAPSTGRLDTAHDDRPMGYVPQDDIVHRELTVEATVRYAARLRLPTGTSATAVAAAVDRALSLLGLEGRRDVEVGALSGGQRKRVSIATELVVRPDVCFLDEPTAGLDPDTGKALMDQLRALADEGTSIVMTTHNLADLQVADRVIRVAPGGGVSLDDADNDDLPPLPEPTPGASINARARRPHLHQIGIMSRRNVDLVRRNKMSLAIMTASPVLVVAMFCVLFPPHTFDHAGGDVSTSLAITYWLAFNGFFFGLTFGLLQVCTELAIVRRERLVTIDIGPYLIAKALVLLPVLGLVNGVMLMTLVRLGRLPTLGTHDLATVWAILVVDASAGLALGLLASASVSTTSQAALALPMLCFPAVLFSGAILPVASMTPLGHGIAALISDRWAFEALARTIGAAGPADRPDPMIRLHHGALTGPIGAHLAVIVAISASCITAAWVVLERRTRPQRTGRRSSSRR